MSISWLLDVDPAPRILVLPDGAASLDEAHAAIELWEHYSRKTLDPAQRLTVEVMMAQTSSGSWAAATTGREMSRQQGKGDEIEVPELWGLVQRGEAILHTVHDAALLATQAQQRMLNMLEGHPDLRRLVKRRHIGVGQQMIEMRNGGTIWYRTRSGGGGRGVDDVDRLVVDEAQHATDEHIAALSPTLYANSNPQMNVMGTSGLAGRSDWWWGIRTRALGADPGEFGYVGHTAESVSLDAQGNVVQQPVDVSDRSLWPLANPALATGRGGGMAFLEEQFRRMSPEAFANEHLGVWAPPSIGGLPAKLPADRWAQTIRKDNPQRSPGEITLSFDVDIDGIHAAIAIGAGTIGDPYVELVDYRNGVGWLPARMVELVEKWKPLAVGCNGAGPAGAQVGPVLQAFRDAGVDVELQQMNAVEYKQACGGIYTDVVEGRLHRPPGQIVLDEAGENAAERPLGDAWAWDRRNASVPISPLVAVTIARALLPVEVEASKPVFAF